MHAPVERYVHHGQEVAVISRVKGLHRDHCLCFQGCVHFKPGKEDNCEIAQQTYLNCVRFGTTTPVFECPKFESVPRTVVIEDPGVMPLVAPPVRITTDPTDPRLGRGVDEKPVPQHAAYLVLSDEERAKGFVRPVRRSYMHIGPPPPKYPLRDLTEEEQVSYKGLGYVKFETYPKGSVSLGRFWTEKDLHAVGRKGCGGVTTMGVAIAETYARDPKFYGSTYCVHCSMHLPVAEFVWDGTSERVGS